MSPLQSGKLWLLHNIGLSKDALHVYVALLLFLASVALLRWPMSSGKPWLVVALAAFVGEAWDLRDSVVHGTPVVLAANLHDVVNTLFWPTILVLLARRGLLRVRG